MNRQRQTPQRQALLNELQGRSDHPTAEALHDSVRRDLPKVSLGTIYRNLDELCSAGLARKMSQTDGPSRYDGRVEAHHHIRCCHCDAIVDLLGINAPHLAEQAESKSGYSVQEFSIEFTGTCSRCRPN
jgi:Fe2+ or Zn2+ uptake regulation protein